MHMYIYIHIHLWLFIQVSDFRWTPGIQNLDSLVVWLLLHAAFESAALESENRSVWPLEDIGICPKY